MRSKTSPHWLIECREFAADVYKNNGYSKESQHGDFEHGRPQGPSAIVSRMQATMSKNSIEEAKADLNKKAAAYGMISGACYNTSCRVDTEQQLKAYTLGSYYASSKKFPRADET
ncbi:hypothetical protein MJ585_28050 [Klebsiella pneumoniae]|nr:hypothetical protein MJ585_28050 [Klebsiella pneumoniae]